MSRLWNGKVTIAVAERRLILVLSILKEITTRKTEEAQTVLL
jgi:hypothetical protein